MQIDQPLPFTIAICTFAGLALVMLHPKPSVRIEGEIAMLEPAIALQRLDAATDIVMDDNLALTHAALALEAGEFDVAKAVLARLQAEGQETYEIELMLATANRLSHDPKAEIDHLAAAYAMTPTATLRQQLGLAYRADRQSAAEQTLLLSVSGLDLTSYEARRLADLLRQSRQFVVLEALYFDRAEGDGPDADDAKHLFINHLLEGGRLKQAQQTALRWFSASGHNQHMLQTAIPAFLNWGAIDGAMALAMSGLKTAPVSSYLLIEVFLDSGEQGSALAFQQAWLDQNDAIPSEAWPALIKIAERTGYLAGLRTAISKTAADALPADQMSAVLLQFLRYQGPVSLSPLSAYLRPDVLQSKPLIGAAWASIHGSQMDAAAFLIASANDEMSDWDWQIWANTAATLKGTFAYQTLLLRAPTQGRARSVLEAGFMARPEQPVPQLSAGKGD